MAINIRDLANTSQLSNEDFIIIEQTAGTRKATVGEVIKSSTSVYFTESKGEIDIEKPDIDQKIEGIQSEIRTIKSNIGSLSSGIKDITFEEQSLKFITNDEKTIDVEVPNMHIHANQSLLDEITEERLQSWDNGGQIISDNNLSMEKTWSSSKIEDYVLTNVGALWQEINGGQLAIDNTMDGFLREIEILGNTVQSEEDLSDIQHLGVWNEEKQGYEIEITVSNSNNKEAPNYQEYKTSITIPCQLMKVGKTYDRLYWDSIKCRYIVEKNTLKFLASYVTRGVNTGTEGFIRFMRLNDVGAKENVLIIDSDIYTGNRSSDWVNLHVPSDFYYNNNYTVSNTEAARFLQDYPVNIICARSKIDKVIETNITEELRLPTYMNGTYVTVSGGVEGSIKAKAPVDGGKIISSLQEENIELKTRNKELDETINTMLLMTEQMYNMFEPLSTENMDNEFAFNMYMVLVKKNLKKIEEVPEKYRDKVLEIINT